MRLLSSIAVSGLITACSADWMAIVTQSMWEICMDWGNRRGHFYFDGQSKRCLVQTYDGGLYREWSEVGCWWREGAEDDTEAEAVAEKNSTHIDSAARALALKLMKEE
ncbi:hypothetical protein B0I35DRAFT_459505 [Stachybotrys elegans]|uniref:Apple domain-containing protein n=1 Tax=Stachybotrys elegans TaxID=80388 RepID=A0A8K0SYZ0_9HYPO|nr:hypothetical protein B0I35DRAFT_459505 [Stachybotrys elegans]